MSDTCFAGEGRKRSKVYKGTHKLHPILSDRQVEIARLIGQGFSSKEVASGAGISVKTSDTHRANILRLTGTHNACQLTIWLFKNKLLNIEELPDQVSPAQQ